MGSDEKLNERWTDATATAIKQHPFLGGWVLLVGEANVGHFGDWESLMAYAESHGLTVEEVVPATGKGHSRNYWTEREAGGNIELPRCAHGVPRNVFCGRCES